MADYALRIRRKCSENFVFADLVQAGETWRWVVEESGLNLEADTFNVPQEEASWDALERLACEVLEPLVRRWGRPVITYGFAGVELIRHVRRRVGRIAPSLDQHAAHERRRDGGYVCDRLGAAVDLWVPNVSSRDLARWLSGAVSFDRIYFYGDDRPVHVSWGPDRTGAMTHVRRVGKRVLPVRVGAL